VNLVAVKNLREGCVLSEDVRDINGRLMLSKGQQINSNHIRIFKMWGISEVRVNEDCRSAVNHDFSGDREKLLLATNTVTTVLQNLDTTHPAIAEIYRAAIAYRYRKNLFILSEDRRPLPDNFKLDLSKGLKTQIAFSDLKLPEAPDIIIEYNKIIQDPMCSIDDIADVVNRSPSLAAMLLKMANSAFYGFASKIDTVSRAITLIGTRETSSLVMGICTMKLFHDIPKELADVSSFLRHSLSCGILSRILASRKNVPHTERFFVAGLLHDIGRTVWYKYFSEQAKLLLRMAEKTGICLYRIEQTCLGINHGEISEYLLKKWNFPDTLINSIVYHHSPLDSPDPEAAGIVHLADIAINALGVGHSGEQIIPAFEPEVWEHMRLTPSVLKTSIDLTVHQLEVMEVLFSELQNG
jgi:putative nucleotidyltransferase with HDIG domain